jgi:hypothetical protein
VKWPGFASNLTGEYVPLAERDLSCETLLCYGHQGHFEVRQAKVVPGHWDMTTMSLEMTGEALLFKREFYQFNTTLCPAMTVAGRMLLPTLTEYFPAGKETGWLTCLDATCVPEASSTA